MQPSFPPLTERQRAILRLVVQEYVASGRPVGSKTLVDRHSVGYSSATIRHEMADLEAAGYVQHLHTSGGRVPTDAGYRYFVHHLLGNVELPSNEQIMIRHQFRFFIDGRYRRARRMPLSTLTSKKRLHSSSEISSNALGSKMPRLLTRISTSGNLRAASSATAA